MNKMFDTWWKILSAIAVGILGIGVAWGKLTTDIEYHDKRIKVVEERTVTDHDSITKLLEMKETVDRMDRRVLQILSKKNACDIHE